MRKSKKAFALLLVGFGISFLVLGFTQYLSKPFMIATGSAIIAYGLVSYLFEHFVHKIGRVKIMDEDERNIILAGKANTLVSEFTSVGFIVLAFYSYFYMHDLMGCIISITIFMLSHIVYAISFRMFDKN